MDDGPITGIIRDSLSSYSGITFVNTNDEGDYKMVLNTESTGIYTYSESDKYIMKEGVSGESVYIIMEIPELFPIAILNKGKEHLIDYDGYFAYKKTDIGPDGFEYDFYYGHINIFVKGNFGKVSLYVNGSNFEGYYGGNKILHYSPDAKQGYSKEAYGSFVDTSVLTNEVVSTTTNIFNITVSVQNIISQSNYQIYIMSGEDRSGQLRSAQQPTLSFYRGDTVNFYIENDIMDSQYFAIYTNSVILNNSQQVNYYIDEDNNQTILQWRPVELTNDYYYYKSQNNHNTNE